MKTCSAFIFVLVLVCGLSGAVGCGESGPDADGVGQEPPEPTAPSGSSNGEAQETAEGGNIVVQMDETFAWSGGRLKLRVGVIGVREGQRWQNYRTEADYAVVDLIVTNHGEETYRDNIIACVRLMSPSGEAIAPSRRLSKLPYSLSVVSIKPGKKVRGYVWFQLDGAQDFVGSPSTIELSYTPDGGRNDTTYWIVMPSGV